MTRKKEEENREKGKEGHPRQPPRPLERGHLKERLTGRMTILLRNHQSHRSEERRVGKEC